MRLFNKLLILTLNLLLLGQLKISFLNNKDAIYSDLQVLRLLSALRHRLLLVMQNAKFYYPIFQLSLLLVLSKEFFKVK